MPPQPALAAAARLCLLYAACSSGCQRLTLFQHGGRLSLAQVSGVHHAVQHPALALGAQLRVCRGGIYAGRIGHACQQSALIVCQLRGAFAEVVLCRGSNAGAAVPIINDIDVQL